MKYFPNLIFPLTSGGGGGGGSYVLPVATSGVLGGVKADAVTDADTQAVRIGTDGKLYTTAQTQSNWTETDTTATDYVKNKPTLATVATSGAYADLSGKPSMPDVSNKQDKATVVTDTTSTDIVVTLAGNTEYYYGTLTSLNVTAAASGLSWLRFTSGTTATTLTATGFTWAGGTAPTIAASKTYELNIKDGYALCLEY